MVFTFVIVFFIVIMAAAYQSSQSKPKESAREYFEIYDAEYIGLPQRIGGGVIMSVSELTFKIRAVKGDAHDVNVQCAQSQPDYVSPKDIPKGQSATGYLTSIGQFPVEEGTFEVEIVVSCAEAYGTIFVTFNYTE